MNQQMKVIDDVIGGGEVRGKQKEGYEANNDISLLTPWELLTVARMYGGLV